MVKEHEGEHEHSKHHAEGGRVVGVGGWDESLVLVVAQRAHWHLGGGGDTGQTKAMVVNLKLKFGNKETMFYGKIRCNNSYFSHRIINGFPRI